MNNLKITFLSLIAFVLTTNAQIIESTAFEGLTKTKESYLRLFIKSLPGSDFDSITLKKDVTNLKNLNLFFNVTASYSSLSENLIHVQFTIEEAVYIYPIIQIDGFDGTLKLQIGANNINWRGRGYTLGGNYQYYDRHSFKVYQISPRHKNNKTGHEISIGKYSTIEPLYSKDTASDFNFDNYSLSLGGKYWLNQQTHLGIGAMYLYEEYKSLENNFNQFPEGSEFMFNKMQVRGYIERNKVNQHFELRDGHYYKLYIENIRTQFYPEINFVKLTQEFKWFKRVKYRGNFAIRNRIGIASNNESPFAPFVIDGFINIRGAGNRVARGTAEIIINTEYRYRIIQNNLFIIQSVFYTDLGVIRDPGSNFDIMLSKNTYYYSGFGIRLNLRKFYNSTIRVDYGVNLLDLSKGGISFGFGQFF